MFSAGINERSYWAAFNNIQAPTLQWEAVVRETTYRESKFEFAIEPRFHGMLIVGSDDSHVARLQ
jgi:hypothetical protein